MRKLVSLFSLPAVLLCAAGVAHAANDGLYVGAGVSRAKLDNIFGSGSDLKIDNTSWKAFAGFKFPLIPIGIEADYTDLGSQTRNFGVTSAHADAKAFEAFAVGWLPLPIPFLDVYGKVGASRWQLDGRTTNSSLFSVDERGTEFAWGVGAGAHVSNVAVRLEYEDFNIKNTDGAKIWTLGAAYYFL